MRSLIQKAILAILLNVATQASADLLSATRFGDTQGTIEALAEGKVDEATLNWSLLSAAQGGHEDIVALLLDAGADANTTFRFSSPLHASARAKNVGILEMLLDAGANPNLATGEHGYSALEFAAEQGAMESAIMLIDHGGDVSFRDNLGQTPLLLALQRNEAAMAELLLQRGAEPVQP